MKNALLIIDVQQGLFDELPGPAGADAVIGRINALAARARTSDAPVILVQHEVPGTQLQHGAPGWQLDSRLQAGPVDHRIRKTTPDSFLRTGLDEVLAFSGVEQLVICGYATEFCVDTTVRTAAAHGYAVILAADAHTTQDKAHASAAQIRAHHNATLPAISSFGPVIEAVPADDIRFTS